MLLMKLKRFISIYTNRSYIVWNRIKFKMYSVKYGKNFKVYNKIYMRLGEGARVEIGDNFVFLSGDNLNALARNLRGCITLSPNVTLKIGNNVGISSSSLRVNQSITFGNDIRVGGDFNIYRQ